jgi:hypothetical protein
MDKPTQQIKYGKQGSGLPKKPLPTRSGYSATKLGGKGQEVGAASVQLVEPLPAQQQAVDSGTEDSVDLGYLSANDM